MHVVDLNRMHDQGGLSTREAIMFDTYTYKIARMSWRPGRLASDILHVCDRMWYDELHLWPCRPNVDITPIELLASATLVHNTIATTIVSGGAH